MKQKIVVEQLKDGSAYIVYSVPSYGPRTPLSEHKTEAEADAQAAQLR